ncbi:anti-sigma factor family protein [Micromonospora deserti]|uniref:Zinc-finger domain-containing protein n=1 Tax=Micromonospora deserti TaxID=2070366 RepID=A0A2W2CUF2_9ACTN|nr:hypothetical protein [Micromonospora deserti]PZG01501.1 hypothetical protein C1I99_06725 [Micromonospora deserti]
MNDRREPCAGTGTWHASPVLLAAYAAGRAHGADVWSVEAHLIACPQCRAELAAVLEPTDQELLGNIRDSVVTALPQRRTARIRRGVGWLRWVLRPGTLIAVGVAVLGATALDLVAGVGDRDGGVLWLLAPAIPLTGVALAAVGEEDPCWEAILAAPSALLRLVLWRTIAVLMFAVPLASVAGGLRVAVAGQSGWNAAWLLPCLALTSATLAGGAFIGVERAARCVGLLWCAATLGPPLVRTGGDALAAVRLAAAPLAETPAFAATAQVGWALVTLFFVAVVVLTRGRYEVGHHTKGVTHDVI